MSKAVHNEVGRVVGEIAGGILRKNAKPGHMLERPAGWAWDVSILRAAERAGVAVTEICCSGRVWRASLADFRRYGVEISRGHGAQIVLPVKYWTVRKEGEKPAAVQLALFGAGNE